MATLNLNDEALNNEANDSLWIFFGQRIGHLCHKQAKHHVCLFSALQETSKTSFFVKDFQQTWLVYLQIPLSGWKQGKHTKN